MFDPKALVSIVCPHCKSEFGIPLKLIQSGPQIDVECTFCKKGFIIQTNEFNEKLNEAEEEAKKAFSDIPGFKLGKNKFGDKL